MTITLDKEIDIFVATRIGSLKHIKYYTDPTKNNKKNIENLIDIKTLQKDDSITCMSWRGLDQKELIISKKNKQIQIYDTQKACYTHTYTADFGNGDIVGLGRCKRKLIAASSSGVVKIWSKKEEQLLETGGSLDRLRLCPDDVTLFATGGEENDVKLWRVGDSGPVFSAKNLANDWLQLRRPVWVSDLCFIPGEGGNLVAACSRHGYVRLYDIRAQRRPVINVEFTNMAATCISPSFQERLVLVGFGRGQLHQVDLRKGKPDKGFKGCVGAITGVAAVDGDERLVVSTSLDRHLRVHRYESKEMVYKQYLTSKLSHLLVQINNSTPLIKREDDIKEEETEDKETMANEMDEIFDNMETIGEPLKRKLVHEKRLKKTPVDILPEKKIKPSTETSSEVDIEDGENTEDAIKHLLKSTEKKKRKMEKKKKEKKAKSLFYNA